jgi:hypothetical protein
MEQKIAEMIDEFVRREKERKKESETYKENLREKQRVFETKNDREA